LALTKARMTIPRNLSVLRKQALIVTLLVVQRVRRVA